MHRSLSVVVCLVALAAAGVCPAANPAFRISIDAETWRKFGWQYPATYVFRYRYVAEHAQVVRQP
jgi:hypothetical protein